MKKSVCLILLLIMTFLCIEDVDAATYRVTITGNGVALREDNSTDGKKITSLSRGAVYSTSDNSIYPNKKGCADGWYKINYNSGYGFVCATYATIEEITSSTTDAYGRPWLSPKAAIVGGAKFVSGSYISKGQFTSYLKKFNVNPNGYYKVYNHQYMANLRAPYSEAYSSYKSYRDNGLLALPLDFTIPIFENMPEYTAIPGESPDTSCQSEITDWTFENALNEQEFPESYKCKLRLLHNLHANWTFKSLKTGLNFQSSVAAEKSVSSVQGGDKYYDWSSGDKIQTETGWYIANDETVAYFLDPRNFIKEERILMFESLAYSDNFSESVVQSILTGTFMEGYSFLDNQQYASIFVEAGRNANMSAVYLASLARQESGTNGSKATSGDIFTYEGVTYQGLFNFFNIGAYSSAASPILAGLVWASGGLGGVVTSPSEGDNGGNTTPNVVDENTVLSLIGSGKREECLVDLPIGTTLLDIKNRLNGFSVIIDGMGDQDILRTGQVITVSNGTSTFVYTLAIKGDVDGDGQIGATDYVKIKNYIMERSGSELTIAQSLAADIDGNGQIGATDYVKIKNSIMER
ncbi:MAG: hypothetical protein K2M17_03865 [Bacilli bacterium]|nr:hypothetical protein [Bacilli bacterium]